MVQCLIRCIFGDKLTEIGNREEATLERRRQKANIVRIGCPKKHYSRPFIPVISNLVKNAS